MGKSSIEWTEATWNPVVGCSHISPGCDNCYAEKAAASPRLQRFERYREVITGKKWNGKTVLHEETLQQPLHWRTPRMVFADSITDLFHESIPFETVARVVDIIRRCPQHTFQILTKREQRMHNYFHHHMRDHFPPEMQVLPNLWLGVTVENNDQRHRIEKLLQTPAAVRFISAEPLLDGLDLLKYFADIECGECDWLGFTDNDTPEGGLQKVYKGDDDWQEHWDEYDPDDDGLWICPKCKAYDSEMSYAPVHNPHGDNPRINQIICGGESGPRARPMHPDNPRSLRDQCAAAGIPFFFKQWGEWVDHAIASVRPNEKNARIVFSDGTTENWRVPEERVYKDWVNRGGRSVVRVGKKKAGCLLDGIEHKEYPRNV